MKGFGANFYGPSFFFLMCPVVLSTKKASNPHKANRTSDSNTMFLLSLTPALG